MERHWEVPTWCYRRGPVTQKVKEMYSSKCGAHRVRQASRSVARKRRKGERGRLGLRLSQDRNKAGQLITN